MTNACMTDSATLGDYKTPAPKPLENQFLANSGIRLPKRNQTSVILSHSLVTLKKQTGRVLL